MSAETPDPTAASEPTLRELLAAADRVLGDVESPDDAVDAVIDDIARLDLAGADGFALPGSVGPSQIDPVVLQRVIAVLTARRAAVAVELADLGRQRAELARRHRGVAGYTRSGG